MPKLADIVRYSAFGRSLNALVLAVRNTPTHAGANGEPVLDLAFIDPSRESAIEKQQIGYQPRVYIEHDVVHVSQEFSAEFKKDKGITTPAQIIAQRGQGEWDVTAADELLQKSLAQLTEARAQIVLLEAQVAADSHKAAEQADAEAEFPEPEVEVEPAD